MNYNKLYTAKEVSEIIGVRPSTISQWDKKGLIKYQFNEKNKKIYDISSVPEKYKSNISLTNTSIKSSTNVNINNSIPNKSVPNNTIPNKSVPNNTIPNKSINTNTNISKINNYDSNSDSDDDENSYEEFTKSLDPETAEKVKKDKEKFELLLSIIDKIVVNHFSNDSTKNIDVSDIVRKYSDRDSLNKLDKLSDLFISKERENENDFHRYLFKNILPKLSESESENIINFIRNKKLYKAYINYTDRFMRLVIKEIKIAIAKENTQKEESNNNDSNNNESNNDQNNNESNNNESNNNDSNNNQNNNDEN